MPRWKILPLQQVVLSCEAEKASLISDCSKEGGLLNTGICEIYCLRKSMWLILSFIWTSSKNPELVFSSSQTFFLFYLFLAGVAFPWQRAEEVTFSFNLVEPDLSSPAAQRIFSLTQKQTMLLIEESGFKLRSLCFWRSSLWRYSGTAGFHSFLWLALFDLIVQSPASTFWLPGSVVHTRQAVIYGLIWQLLETLGRKEKWGLEHFCFFYFKNNLNVPSSKASSAFEPKLF